MVSCTKSVRLTSDMSGTITSDTHVVMQLVAMDNNPTPSLQPPPPPPTPPPPHTHTHTHNKQSDHCDTRICSFPKEEGSTEEKSGLGKTSTQLTVSCVRCLLVHLCENRVYKTTPVISFPGATQEFQDVTKVNY